MMTGQRQTVQKYQEGAKTLQALLKMEFGGVSPTRPQMYTRNLNGPGGFRPPTNNYANPTVFPMKERGGIMRQGKCGGIMYKCRGGKVKKR